MSVRSTNVYEENSLGIFEDDDESVDENFTPVGSTATVWSRYLALHMRKQLSFGTDSSVCPHQIVTVFRHVVAGVGFVPPVHHRSKCTICKFPSTLPC